MSSRQVVRMDIPALTRVPREVSPPRLDLQGSRAEPVTAVAGSVSEVPTLIRVSRPTPSASTPEMVRVPRAHPLDTVNVQTQEVVQSPFQERPDPNLPFEDRIRWFQAGDTVVVERVLEEEEGWCNIWALDMSDSVGEVLRVAHDHGRRDAGYGILLSDHYYYPPGALRKVRTEPVDGPTIDSVGEGSTRASPTSEKSIVEPSMPSRLCLALFGSKVDSDTAVLFGCFSSVDEVEEYVDSGLEGISQVLEVDPSLVTHNNAGGGRRVGSAPRASWSRVYFQYVADDVEDEDYEDDDDYRETEDVIWLAAVDVSKLDEPLDISSLSGRSYYSGR